MLSRSRFSVARRFAVRRVATALFLVISLFPVRSGSAPADFHVPFGTGGSKRIVFPGNAADHPGALTTQIDGKTLVAGTCDVGSRKMVYVERLLTDGTLDPAFGDLGRVYTDIGSNLGIVPSTVGGVSVRADAKLVVAGSTAIGHIFLIRYNSDGTRDPSFGGGDGSLVHSLNPPLWEFWASGGLALLADGRILVGGTVWIGSTKYGGVTRFLEDGSFDTSFAGDGLAIEAAPSGMGLHSIEGFLMQLDGSALLVGTVASSTPARMSMFVARFTTAGALDPTFSVDGYALATLPALDLYGSAAAIQVSSISPTKIVVAGRTPSDIALARFNLDGSLDGSFGAAGIATYSANAGADGAIAVRIPFSSGEPSRIVVAGTGLTGGADKQVVVARFFLSGGIDAAFDGDGVIHVPVSAFDDVVTDMALTNTGAVLALATVENTANTNTAIVRVLANGGLDAGWDTDGVRIDDIGARPSTASTFVHQSDGKILVGGSAEAGAGDADGVIARLESTGALDTSFGTAGAALLPQLASARVEKLLLDPSGKVVCVAEDGPPATRDFVLARLQSNGALDPTFAIGGTLDYIYSLADVVVADAALDASDRLLVVGTAVQSSSVYYVFLARFLPSGSMDASFGASGVVQHAFGSSNQNRAHAVALQPDGKFLVAGVTNHGGTIGRQMTVARFNSDGFLDTTFDSDGFTFVDFVLVPNSNGSAILVEADGRIVVAGEAEFTTQLCVARLLSNGALDSTFELDGMVVRNVPYLSEEGGISMARRPNGGYLVCGAQMAGGWGTFVCAMEADGSIAPAYGPDGIASIAAGGFSTLLEDGAFNATGRILLCGSVDEIFSMVRLVGETVVTGAGAPGPNGLESNPSGLFLSAPSPNPARGTVRFTVASDSPRTIDVRVVDVAGRLLRRVERRRFEEGRHELSWDLLDGAGRKVLPGVYFLRAFADGENRSRKILVAE